jgi:hypothetical protein
MTTYFLDSSALIKRHITETGTTWIRSIVAPSAQNTIIIAQVTQAEVVSGAMRRKREAAISDRTARAIRLLLDRQVIREYQVIRLSNQIMQRSENLLEIHPLRAYDAIQLASALESNNLLLTMGLTPLVFISADIRLLTASTAEGMNIENPNAHP